MKNLFLTLAAFSLAFLIGCQENLINEPSGVLTKSEDNLITSNTIKLNQDVQDPLYGISRLTGRVSYARQVIYDAMNPSAQERISLQINIDCNLNDLLGMVHLEWRVQGRSTDVIYVSEEGIVLLEKSYQITNRTDVILLVQYLVTTNGVGISNVSLVPLEK